MTKTNGILLALAILLASGMTSFAQSGQAPPAALPFEVIQNIFQLGAATHQQVQGKVNEMQARIETLSKELEAAKKNCPAGAETAK